MRTLAVIIAFAVFLPALAFAQTDSGNGHTPPYLTWDDAPITTPLRHKADIVTRMDPNDQRITKAGDAPREYHVGDITSFIIGDTVANNERFKLLYISDNAYFWFQLNSDVQQSSIVLAANRFENEILPLLTRIYGQDLPLGVDDDARIHLVHMKGRFASLAGFFSPDDQCAQSVCPHSNERDMLYLMLDYGPINSELYLATLSHELQHLIQFHSDGNEYRWIDEGISQLIEHLNGFTNDPINNDNVEAFFANPNHMLNYWSIRYGNVSPYYGAGYLFTLYLYERFGIDFIQQLVLDERDGLAGVNHALVAGNYDTSLDQVVQDWHVANYLDNPFVGDGRYYYSTYQLPAAVLPTRLNPRGGQLTYRSVLKQYGAEYLEISEPGEYTLQFAGDPVVYLLPIEPVSGDAMWWSYNATASVTTLSRTVDLRDVDEATLNFNIWYATEDYPSYLHVLASADQGMTWTPLAGRWTTDHSINENAPGDHYAGNSNRWLDESIDLTPFAGNEISLRFEYVTNNAIVGPGFVLDDIKIPEIGWSDDVEVDAGDWDANGFLRTTQYVAQEWGVQLITNEEQPRITPIDIVEGTGTVTLTVPEGGAVIVISAMAPFSTTGGNYQFELSRN